MASGLKVTAPLSISNINCGFDALGASLSLISDQIIGRRMNSPGVKINTITGEGKHLVSTDPYQNTAGVAILRFLEFLNIRTEGVELEIHKKVKCGSGLGSSAASACGAVVLANALFGHPLQNRELFPLAILGEYVASQAFHADNVAPCLFGGIMLVRDTRSLSIHRLHIPDNLLITIVLPELQIITSEARKMLKPDVHLKQMVRQSANLGSFVLALERNDYELLSASLQDHVIEPQRAHLIPGFYEIKEAAFKAGVTGCGISGSGPSLFAFSRNTSIAEEAGLAMQRVLKKHKVESRVMVARIDSEGTVLH
jgi:homoserine kinase